MLAEMVYLHLLIYHESRWILPLKTHIERYYTALRFDVLNKSFFIKYKLYSFDLVLIY